MKTCRISMIRRNIFVLVSIASILLPLNTLASEGGAGHYLPGAVATLIDLAPSKPGWVVEPIYLHYEGDVDPAQQIPVAGVDTLGMNAKLDVLMLGGLYSFKQPVLGATYSVGAYLPYVWMTVEAEVVTLRRDAYVRDQQSGLGDVSLIPLMMAWENGFWQYNAILSVNAPTGEYELGDLANPGLNYWSFDPVVGVSYNHPTLGFNAALHGGVTFSTENNDTDYQSGSMFHLDGSVQQMLPVGPGFVSLGAEAFYLQQLSSDSGQREIFGDFKGRSAGIGPVLGYILPVGEDTLVTELRWLPELETKNRLKGDYIWLKIVYQF
jgi:hypothetical protein